MDLHSVSARTGLSVFSLQSFAEHFERTCNFEEPLILAANPLPEVRASVARALGRTNATYTLPALPSLETYSEWFLRLRAHHQMARPGPEPISALLRTSGECSGKADSA
jgi:hypothetical protein